MVKSVLVTGGAGFIGHHVIKYLLDNTNMEIVSLDRLDYSGNLNRIAEILEGHSEAKRLKIVWHDLKAEISDLVRQQIGFVDYILHIAASSHVDRSIKYPMEFVQDNVIGTVNLLNFAVKLNQPKGLVPTLERFIYFSTDEVFGVAPQDVKFSEWDRYNSTNPYSASKAAAEEFCVAYENTYKLPVYIMHTMNVIGERQHPEKFIPMCIKQVRSKQTVLIHADPTCTIPGTRHYIHAEEVADAIHFLMNLTPEEYNSVMWKYGDPYHVGKCPKFNIVGTEEIDNFTVVSEIARVMHTDFKTEFIDFHSSRPGHDLRYSLDGSLMKELGWTPKRTFRENIERITKWSLANDRWIR